MRQSLKLAVITECGLTVAWPDATRSRVRCVVLFSTVTMASLKKNACREHVGCTKRAESSCLVVSRHSFEPDAIEGLLSGWIVPQLVATYVASKNSAEQQDNLESVCDA